MVGKLAFTAVAAVICVYTCVYVYIYIYLVGWVSEHWIIIDCQYDERTAAIFFFRWI